MSSKLMRCARAGRHARVASVGGGGDLARQMLDNVHATFLRNVGYIKNKTTMNKQIEQYYNGYNFKYMFSLTELCILESLTSGWTIPSLMTMSLIAGPSPAMFPKAQMACSTIFI